MGGAASLAVPEQIRFPDLLSLAPLLSQHTPGHTVNVNAMQLLFKKNRCAEGYMSRDTFLELVRLFDENPDLRRTILQRSADYKHADVTIKKELPPMDTIYRLRDDAQYKDLHFLNFEAFRNHGSYPCFSNPAIAKEGQEELTLTTPANEINFETSYLIFVSHTWCSREEPKGLENFPKEGDKVFANTHPDTEFNDQYKVCLSGLNKFIQAHCNGFDNVYLWIDYACLDLTPANIEHTLNNLSLYNIMHLCDSIFTPLVDNDVNWDFPSEMEYFYEDYNLAPFCAGPNAYMNRSWCRIEMFFGSNVPLLGDITAEEIEPFHAEHTRHFKIENGFPVDTGNGMEEFPASPKPMEDTSNIASSSALYTGNPVVDAQITALLPLHMKMLEPKQPPPQVVYLHTPAHKPLFFSRRMRMSNRLRTRAFSEHRPHAIYSSYEYRFGLPPMIISPISNLYLEKYAPLAGYCSRKDDRSIYMPSIDTEEVSPVNSHSTHSSPHGFQSAHANANANANTNGANNSAPRWNGAMSTSSSTNHFSLAASSNNSNNNSLHTLTSPYKSALDLDRKHYHADPKAVADRRQKRTIPAVLIRLNEEVHALIAKGKVGYDGELNEDGERHGRGIYTYPNGETYVGEWEHGKKQGHGCFKHSNGDVYTCEFFQDREHGLGTIQYANGDNYFGLIHNRKRSGHGLLEYANKDVYEGEFLNHLRHGEGVMKYNDGNIYTGMYEEDRRHGMGVLSDAKKAILYHGYWHKDQQMPEYLPPEGDTMSPSSSQDNLSGEGEHKHRHKHKHHHHHHHSKGEDGAEGEHKHHHHHHKHHNKHSHSHDTDEKASDAGDTHSHDAHPTKTSSTSAATATHESADVELPVLSVTKSKAELKEQIKHMHMKHSSAKLQTFQEIAEQHQNEVKAKPKKKIKKASAHHATH